MTLRGHIHKGTVVLDAPTSRPDGTPVSVEPLPAPSSEHPRGSAARILQTLKRVGPLQFDPGEWEAIMEDLRRSKQEDLALQVEREKLNGELR
jgi:hypothetical protein